MVNIPTNRSPTSPGEMLREEFLEPMGLTQQQLADGIGVSYQRVNELINGKRGITTSTALRLAKYFNTSLGRTHLNREKKGVRMKLLKSTYQIS